MGEVGDASVFRVWGSRSLVRDTSADKLSARAIPCIILGFPLDEPGWQFYNPTLRRVFPSQNVTFDKSVPFYHLFPYRSAPPPPPPLILAPGPPQVDPLPGTIPVEVVVDSGAAQGAASGGAEPGGAEPGGAEPGGVGSKGAGYGGAEPGGSELGGAEPAGVEPGGTNPQGVEPGGAESEGAECGGAESRGTASSGGPAGASPRLSPRPEPLSPQQLHEWFAQRKRLRSGAAGAGDSASGDTSTRGVGASRLGGAGVTARAGGTGGAAATNPEGAHTKGTGAGSVGGAGAKGARAGDPTEPGGAGARAGGTGASGAVVGGGGDGDIGAVDLGAGGAGAGGVVSGGTGAGGTMRPRPFFVPLLRQPGTPLPAPSPYAEQTDSFTEIHEPESRLASPLRAVHTGHWVPRARSPPVPGTHAMALRPSSVPLRVPLLPPPESSLPAVPDPESDLARAASPAVSRLLATVVTDPSLQSTTISALVAELVDFVAASESGRSESGSPPSIGGECALGTDVLEDRQEDFECLAAALPHLVSMLLAPEGDPDAPDIPTPRSYAEAIPVQSFLQGSLHEEIRLHHPPGFTGSFRDGTQWSLRRPVYGLCQAPREWHDTQRTPLVALGFTPSTADLSLFLRTDMSLPPFYVLVYVDDLVFATADTEVLQRFSFQISSPQPTPLSTGHWLSAPLSDESVKPSGPYPELVGCLITSGMGLMLGGQGPVFLTGQADASWVDDSDTQQSSQGYTFSLGSGSVFWRSTYSSLALSSCCEAEIYAGAMAAQKLRWLTYLLTDLGEQPRSPPVQYVDNKATIALC
ncbi:unnamed protein product [Closterium sp. NIES-54]